VEVGTAFTISAIGDPDGLLNAMERPGGIIAQLEQFIQATIVARQSDAISVPATEIDLQPATAGTAG
jgi:uncharacterized protein YlxW (UPF0749 family)